MERRILAIILILAIGYRFWLWDVFFGWEESDYGNIAMVQGVYQSGFRHYDMNHMPGYYGLSALFLLIQNNSVVAAKLMSTLGGSLSLVGIVLLLKRMAGYKAAILLVLVLFFQPEFSLYSSSALREPVYSMFIIALLWAMILRFWWLAGIAAAMAFLVRFEFPLVLIPIVIVLLFTKGWRAIGKLLIPLVLGIVIWMCYCLSMYETYAFWAHAATSNIETGLGAEAYNRWDWFQRGMSVVGSLFFTLLPQRLGWLIWIGWLLAPFWAQKESKIWYLLWLSYGLVVVWLGIAFVAQHDADHNLYWKWMFPLIPILACCGIWMWNCLLVRIARRYRRYVYAMWVLIIGSTWLEHGKETKNQLERSWRLYRPQIQLAQKIEQELPINHKVIFDNIPACWINRKEHEYTMISWFDIPVSPNDPNAFADWLIAEDVWGVLWFREDWTQAPKIAPFLSAGGTWSVGQLHLREVSREDEYGWIYYQRTNLLER